MQRLVIIYVASLIINEIVISTDPCAQYVNTIGTSLGLIGGNCLAVNTRLNNGKLKTSCNIGKNQAVFTSASIDSMETNTEIADALSENGIEVAYHGYVSFDNVNWFWKNNDKSTFSNWKSSSPVVPRSTVSPNEQRRSTAVVIAIDASIYSTKAQILAQISFAESLIDYISDRGPSEFAVYVYGCSKIDPWTDQYPFFVSDYNDAFNMIQHVKDQVSNTCVRSDPLDFQSCYINQQILYYNRNMFSPRPFKSEYISMIFFSSSTNSSNIQTTAKLFSIPDSSFITINIGSESTSIQKFAIPSGSNWFRATTVDEIQNLVLKVDSIIFGSSSQLSNSFADPNIIRVANYSDCAYLNSTDGFWYSDGSCSTKRANLCQFSLPKQNQLIPPVQDPCPKEFNFTSFGSLKNSKCYKVSPDKKPFNIAENECATRTYLHTSKLTSIESFKESNLVDTLLDSFPNEGMFWIGLRRYPTDPSHWTFINGDPFDPAIFNNWKDGYPRDVDGYDCVAYVSIDKKWINTDCKHQIHSICSYRFNETSLT